MEYLFNGNVPENLVNAIDVISEIPFEENLIAIQNDTYLINKVDAERSLDGRISPVAENSFAITQSFDHDGELVHLIVINEQFCYQLGADIIAVLLHEIGHVINEFGTKLSILDAFREGMSGVDLASANRNIQLQNEYYADYIAKKYSYRQQMIDALQASINHGYNDEELNLRIAELQADTIRISGRARTHTFSL